MDEPKPKQRKLHPNADPDIPQSDVPGVNHHKANGKWRGKEQNLLERTVSGGQKSEYTKYFDTKEEAEEALVVLKARMHATYLAKTQQMADEDPLCKHLERGPDNPEEAEDKKAYWRPKKCNGHKPFKCVRMSAGKDGFAWKLACQEFGCNSIATQMIKGQPGQFCLACTTETPHQCPECPVDMRFKSERELKAHMERWHTEKGKQRKKKQEERMKNALVVGGFVESFQRGRVPPPRQFVREVYVDHRCALAKDFAKDEKKCAYVDFVVRTPDGRVVFLEVDEGQHGTNPILCETTRMHNVCSSILLSGLEINVFWLRFNSDAVFTVEGVVKQIEPCHRRIEVVQFLNDLKSTPEDPLVQVAYVCYNQQANGWPLVCDDKEYHPNVKPNVVCVSAGSHKLFQPRPF